MKMTLAQLAHQLKEKLAPIYLFSGDEPWQMQQAHALLVKHSQQHGVETRQRFDITPGFDWTTLIACTQNVSLFSQMQLLDVVLANGKPGTQGSQFICDYANNPPPDTILLLRTGKLDATTLRSKWAQAIDNAGVILQVWPIPLRQMPQWFAKQLQQTNLKTDGAGLQLLTEYSEGNLSSGAQTVEKLRLLYSEGHISAEQIAQAIHDTAQYDVFMLVDACLQGESNRSMRILASLREEGNAPTIILWALAREIRALADMAFALNSTPLPQVLQQARVWQNRKGLVTAALKKLSLAQLHCLLNYAHEIDCSIKGINHHNPWQQLSRLCLWLTKPKLISQQV